MNSTFPAVISDSLYLPPLSYFVAIKACKEIVIPASEPVIRQSYANKAEVLLANKKEVLSVPVFGIRKRLQIKELKIDYQQKWLNVHLRGIQSAYGKAPFFEYFYSDLEHVYLQKQAFLIDLNRELLTVCLKSLGWDVRLRVCEKYDKNEASKDIRGLIHPKRLMDRDKIYYPHEYQQIFGANFVPNLSIVDLLFCEGPMAETILNRSEKSN
ncbi:WbqC-like protein family protein [Cyclobacterium lianum]|uniref:WbqC-like protein family protein n=1 Tax=Cyclobacterium lianum TaxID=388280 RepID=A0A1M7PX62_9BACT|nr:WbqC family protein [Cyclobacterium lianum]SHN22304.1 WbqC-like protein family protein [Cyclobacterium lianum]